MPPAARRRIDKIARWLLGASAAILVLSDAVARGVFGFAPDAQYLLRGWLFLFFAAAARYALHLAAPLKGWRRGKRPSLKHWRKFVVIFFAAVFIALASAPLPFGEGAAAKYLTLPALAILFTAVYLALTIAMDIKKRRRDTGGGGR